ncbi:MAG TPA: hypothetical protein V6D47_05010 [Oscillatoriaceae cyanobacterium]
MIPFAAKIGIRNLRRRDLHFWVPLLLLWLLLLPIVLLLLPFIWLACRLVDISPFQAIAVPWSILTSLAGTELDLKQPGFSVNIRLY